MAFAEETPSKEHSALVEKGLALIARIDERPLGRMTRDDLRTIDSLEAKLNRGYISPSELAELVEIAARTDPANQGTN